MIVHWVVGLLLIGAGLAWVYFVWFVREAWSWVDVWALTIPAIIAVALGVATIY